jgi:hypothetical protein
MRPCGKRLRYRSKKVAYIKKRSCYIRYFLVYVRALLVNYFSDCRTAVVWVEQLIRNVMILKILLILVVFERR